MTYRLFLNIAFPVLTVVIAGIFPRLSKQASALSMPPVTTTLDSVKPLTQPPSLVNFPSFVQLAQEVQNYRNKGHLIDIETFMKMSKEPNTIILDARSHPMYNMKHIKGAIHLNFADFTHQELLKVIPSKDTRILIYCNNNFRDDNIFFASKISLPSFTKVEPISLALNIPTFINLYGYGYKNVYELSSLISVNDPRVAFEGKALRTPLEVIEPRD